MEASPGESGSPSLGVYLPERVRPEAQAPEAAQAFYSEILSAPARAPGEGGPPAVAFLPRRNGKKTLVLCYKQNAPPSSPRPSGGADIV